MRRPIRYTILILPLFISLIQPGRAQDFNFDDADEITADEAGKVRPDSTAKSDPVRPDEKPNQKSLGSITFKLTGGLYDFEREIRNESTGEQRFYSNNFAHPMVGFEMGFRLGKYPSGLHDPKTGFSYYRSNKGFFTDIEIGAKSYYILPNSYDYEVKQNGVSTEKGTVFLDPIRFVDGKDNISLTDRALYGGSAAKATMFWVNTYYHFTGLNYLMNFGHRMRWFDASIGPSFRVFKYSDYSDPERKLDLGNDNTHATIAIAYRQYIQFHPKFRIAARYFLPAYAAIARATRDTGHNAEEHVIDVSADVYIFRNSGFGAYISVGYEYHEWIGNDASKDRLNLSPMRSGFAFEGRTSGELYGAFAVEIHPGG